jgi:predicted nucleic acid-binding protein
MEIDKGNPHYLPIISFDFKLCDVILSEFYWVLLREGREKEAGGWLDKIKSSSEPSSLSLMIEAVKFRSENKKLNLSFPDALGYIHAKNNHGTFVTGDKAFQKLPHVKYIK